MVRTRETAGLKVGAKAPRKGLSGPSTSASSSVAAKKPREDGGGGNPVCPRETPAWQKPITDFFRQSSGSRADEDGSETADSKENVNPEEPPPVSSKAGSEEPTSEPKENGEKSDPGNCDGGAVDSSSAGSSKE